MALTLIRKSNDYDLNHSYFPHDNVYPAIFQALSDEVENYIDFKYIFELYDYTGLIATYETAPSIDSYGTFDANMYIKNKITQKYVSDVEQELTLFYEYRVKVIEFYNGSTHAESTFLSSLMSNRIDNISRGQIIAPYQDITHLLLTGGIGLDIHLSKTSKGVGYIANWQANEVRYRVTYANGVIWDFKYLLELTYSFSSSTGNALTDGSGSGYTFPFGYSELLSTDLIGVQYYDGTWHNESTVHTGIEDVFNADTPISCEIYEHTDITKRIKLIFNNYCGYSTVNWLNSYGGFDLFSLNIIEQHTLSLEKKIYQSNEIDVNLFTSNNVADKRVILSNEAVQLKMNTDYLTADEIKYIKSIYTSKEIYLNIDGVQYPVILVDKKANIKDTRGELIQFELNFLYAVK